MKKVVYIVSFMLLGFLVQALIYGVVENFYIKLLVEDFTKYSLGLSWEIWFQIHRIGTVLLVLVGLIGGLWQGFYWWPRLYTHDGRRRNLRI